MPCESCQPSPQGDTSLIGPLEVIYDKDGWPCSALFGDERQELLPQCPRDVRAAVSGDLAAQQLHDGGSPGAGGRLSYTQAVNEWEQGEFLA
jgi:hypothetical protein